MRKLQWKWTSGQSIVFVALILLILIAFTGLAVDTGRAFQRQRTIQAASSAGAVSALNAVVNEQQDTEVMTALRQAMIDNGIAADKLVNVDDFEWGTDEDTLYFTAQYLDSTGSHLGYVGAFGTVPNGVAFIRVTSSEAVPTSFSRAVGQDTLTVSAQGAASKDECVIDVYPITFDQSLLSGKNVLRTNETNLPASTLLNGSYNDKIVVVNRDTGAGNFSFLGWLGTNASQVELDASLQEPGNLGKGFNEATPPPADSAALKQMNKQLEVNDWMNSTPGSRAANKATTDSLRDRNARMILPLYDKTQGTGNNQIYHVSRFVEVRMLAANFQGSNKTFTFALMDLDMVCVGDSPPPASTPLDEFQVTIEVQEELRWIIPPALGKNFNLAMVMDYSASMRYCWETNSNCPLGTRRIDYEIPAARNLIQEMLVTRKAGNPTVDNQMALVRFGIKVGSSYTSELLVPFGGDPQPFWNKIGAPGSSYTVPDNQMTGYTPTAAGLNDAITILNASRKVDKNGNPVKLVVLLLTDGLSNVLYDGAYIGRVNDKNGPSRSCIPSWMDNQQALNDPYTQATCPTNNTPARSPIKATIDIANNGRALKMTFYAVALAEPNGLTLDELYLTQIADKAYKANAPGDLDALVQNIGQEIAGACEERKAVPRLAVGATITVEESLTGARQHATVGPDGKVTFTLSSGTYNLYGVHTGVIAPDDPAQKPRDYTRVRFPSTPTAQPSLPFEVGTTNIKLDPVTLFIDNDKAASCDYPNWPSQ